MNEQGGRYDLRRLCPRPRIRNVHTLQKGAVQHSIGSVANGNPPEVFPGVHVNRGDSAVRWLEDWKAMHTGRTTGTSHGKIIDDLTGRPFLAGIPLVAGNHDP